MSKPLCEAVAFFAQMAAVGDITDEHAMASKNNLSDFTATIPEALRCFKEVMDFDDEHIERVKTRVSQIQSVLDDHDKEVGRRRAQALLESDAVN